MKNKNLKRLLITGGSGYLGHYLTRRAAEIFQLYTSYYDHVEQIRAGQPILLDITRREEVLRLMTELKPQAVIHAAAVNPGSGSDETMMTVNAAGSQYVAEAAVAVGARLVHVSTDVVHNGREAPYDDEAPPAPLNGYGRSKAAAEVAVKRLDPGAVLVRTSLIYGLEEMDRGTAGFVERLQRGERLALFNDVIRQPVWVESLAEALLKLVEVEYGGTLNVVGSQPLTREAFGRRMLAWWGIEPGDRLQPARAADLSSTTPLDLRMSSQKAEQLLQMRFPGVDEVLENHLTFKTSRVTSS
jgi:dTDP-4-dehydrorhamnose reductase